MASPNTSTDFSLTLPGITQTLAGYYTISLHYATGAQTLNGISQAALYKHVPLLTSVVEASSSMIVAHPDELVSTAIVSSTMQAKIPASLSSTVQTNSEPTFNVVLYLTSTVNISDLLTSTQHTSLVSRAKITEKITPKVSHLETSEVQASDLIETRRSVSLDSTAQVLSSFEIKTRANYLITSVVLVSDDLQPGQGLTLTSSILATSSIDQLLRVSETLESVVTAEDTWNDTARIFAELTSKAIGTEFFDFTGSRYSETLTSVVNASDWMWAKDFNSIAWVLNTESAGLSNYDNFGFTSLAFHAGKLYATSPEGVFEIDADDDEGRKINSVIGRGFEQFGMEYKKRISDIFVGHTGGGLECDVETYDKQVYTYEMEPREADAPHNSRIRPGKGLSSRWWRFTFRNIGGADFQLQDLTVRAARSQRRL